ncbi:MAG TPA: 4Fe-4S binding protein [Smithellaceae bacterium]|nr:4Fe-4S binding protein [Smithellaceae bacterium]
MKRQIIKIDEEKCTGCGICVPSCQEGAIKIINGKARLVSDVYCDGLGACLSECPEGALTIEERDAEPFDEKKVKEYLAHAGKQTFPTVHACPGSTHAAWNKKPSTRTTPAAAAMQSELTHWPVQLHLVNPAADFLHGKDVVLAADCVAYALPDFHSQFLKGKSLAIACPKLDEGQDIYIEKIRRMVDEAKIKSLTVVMMEVPCCRGLIRMAQQALQSAQRKIPLKAAIISTRGDVLSCDCI